MLVGKYIFIEVYLETDMETVGITYLKKKKTSFTWDEYCEYAAPVHAFIFAK